MSIQSDLFQSDIFQLAATTSEAQAKAERAAARTAAYAATLDRLAKKVSPAQLRALKVLEAAGSIAAASGHGGAPNFYLRGQGHSTNDHTTRATLYALSNAGLLSTRKSDRTVLYGTTRWNITPIGRAVLARLV